MAYQTGLNASARSLPTKQDLISRGMSDAEAQELIDAGLSREYGGGMSQAELQDFENLIGRLETSKLRQLSGQSRARQRETFAGGLANMMGNF